MNESHIPRPIDPPAPGGGILTQRAPEAKANWSLAIQELDQALHHLFPTLTCGGALPNALPAQRERDQFDELLKRRDELELASLFAASAFQRTGCAHHLTVRKVVQDRLGLAQGEVDAWLRQHAACFR